MTRATVLLCAGLGLVAISVAWGALSVQEIAGGEVLLSEGPQVLQSEDGTPHRELVRAELTEGQSVTFEICSTGDLTQLQDQTEFVIWLPDTEDVVIRVPMNEENVGKIASSPGGSCLVLGSADSLVVSGTYAIESVWSEAPPGVPLFARVIASRPLTPSALYPLFALLLGIIVVLASGLLPVGEDREPTASWITATASTIGLALAVLALGFAQLGALWTALGIAIVEVGLAIAWFRCRAWLRWQPPPKRAWLYLLASPFVAGGLIVLGNVARALVPATGVSSAETLISWPSGSLAFALVGLFAPVAEEVFFRGLVFGSLEKYGAPIAVIATTVLFAIFHLPQSWGAWGDFTSIALVGLMLTLVRQVSGSTTVAALVHLLHNGTLIGLSFAGSVAW